MMKFLRKGSYHRRKRMPEGIVLKSYSGFHYVQEGEKLWECSLRGRFRLNKHSILPGDRVKIIPRDEKSAVIDEIFPRDNELIRPSIANVEQLVLVFAIKDPIPNLNLVDRMIILAEANGIKPVICFNKNDLVHEMEREEILATYQATDYPILFTSAAEGLGKEEIVQHLTDRISVFAGPSGVGKSTLLNLIQPGLGLKTGEVSEKIKRGKHTTRHVELIPLDFGGWVADTPGFGTLFLPEMKREDLPYYFPEMEPYLDTCKFNGCLHNKEPQCGVKNAVNDGKINVQRYEHYLQFLDEVITRERRY
jgi:ribosome biogenesis GTPase / thiamine phosphate phosphatase